MEVREKNPENMEALYAFIHSWVTEFYGNIAFPERKGVDKLQDPVEPTSLSVNFAAVFM